MGDQATGGSLESVIVWSSIRCSIVAWTKDIPFVNRTTEDQDQYSDDGISHSDSELLHPGARAWRSGSMGPSAYASQRSNDARFDDAVRDATLRSPWRPLDDNVHAPGTMRKAKRPSCKQRHRLREKLQKWRGTIVVAASVVVTLLAFFSYSSVDVWDIAATERRLNAEGTCDVAMAIHGDVLIISRASTGSVCLQPGFDRILHHARNVKPSEFSARFPADLRPVSVDLTTSESLQGDLLSRAFDSISGSCLKEMVTRALMDAESSVLLAFGTCFATVVGVLMLIGSLLSIQTDRRVMFPCVLAKMNALGFGVVSVYIACLIYRVIGNASANLANGIAAHAFSNSVLRNGIDVLPDVIFHVFLLTTRRALFARSKRGACSVGIHSLMRVVLQAVVVIGVLHFRYDPSASQTPICLFTDPDASQSRAHLAIKELMSHYVVIFACQVVPDTMNISLLCVRFRALHCLTVLIACARHAGNDYIRPIRILTRRQVVDSLLGVSESVRKRIRHQQAFAVIIVLVNLITSTLSLPCILEACWSLPMNLLVALPIQTLLGSHALLIWYSVILRQRVVIASLGGVSMFLSSSCGYLLIVLVMVIPCMASAAANEFQRVTINKLLIAANTVLLVASGTVFLYKKRRRRASNRHCNGTTSESPICITRRYSHSGTSSGQLLSSVDPASGALRSRKASTKIHGERQH